MFPGTSGKLSGATAAGFCAGLDQALRLSSAIVLLAALLTWLASDRPQTTRAVKQT